ncbi:MAG: hypothetical protein HY077_16935 [Elusimicrobia bacterium]|nr:hypothetical protein [Elusimicrobiota bacterium]
MTGQTPGLLYGLKYAKGTRFSSSVYCPWDTIRMVPSASVKGTATSLDTQPNHEHAVFQNPELVPSEVRSFVDKPVFVEPTAAPLFQQWNKEVPNVMGPK